MGYEEARSLHRPPPPWRLPNRGEGSLPGTFLTLFFSLPFYKQVVPFTFDTLESFLNRPSHYQFAMFFVPLSYLVICLDGLFFYGGALVPMMHL